jgi:glycosyltransferase involved in cell wall biosynthesis
VRVAAYTGGVMVPSARARVRQYIAPLSALGIAVREYPLPLGNILPHTRALRPLWMSATAAARIAGLVASWTTDVTWISRQLLPAFAPLHALAHRPMILDVDDAIWLNTGGHRAKTLARAASLVVCGNSFLADHFSLWNRNVAIIPTAVDTAWYAPRPDRTGTESLVLGWTGTSGNFPFLYAIEPALERVLQQCPRASVLIIADRQPLFQLLPRERVEFQAWSPAVEHAAFARFSIGLMPLADTAWCNGKCSYKMLCYMAAGLPVVVTPAGMNREVLAMGNIGLSADHEGAWVDGLIALLENPHLRRQMGDAGRAVIEERFSLQRLAQQYALLFHSLGGQSPRGRPAPIIIPERPVLL